MEGDGIHRMEIPEIPVDAMREAVINSFAHARYDLPVQHEIDIFSDRISIVNPGSFANEFEPIDFVNRDIHSFLRNETIARVLRPLAPVSGKSIRYATQQGLKLNTKMPIRTSKSSFQGSTEISRHYLARKMAG